jgi:methyl coenzyme M reductase beta subunit
VNVQERRPPTLAELVAYINRDLVYLEGVADALDNGRLTGRINGIKQNIKLLVDMVEEVEVVQ